MFLNLRAVAAAAGGSLDDMVKLSILMQDLGDFAKVNEIMSSYFKQPYPARATYQVAALPRGGADRDRRRPRPARRGLKSRARSRE